VLVRRFSFLLLVPLALVAVGTLGYYTIEKEFTLFDSLYMTVITLTTVGFDVPHPLSTGAGCSPSSCCWAGCSCCSTRRRS
jgi:hypothetical protein